MFIIFSFYIKVYNQIERPVPSEGKYTIIDKKTYTYGSAYTIKNKKHKIRLETKNEQLEIGDVVIVFGTFDLINSNVTPRGFNYTNFMKSKRIYYQIKTEQVEKTKKEKSIYSINQSIRTYINGLDIVNKDMFNSLILAKNDFDGSFSYDISAIGVSHLFSVSGLHITLFVLGIQAVLVMLNKRLRTLLTGLILVIYYVITLFKTSIFRAVFCYILGSAQSSYTKLDVLSLSFILTQIYNPLYAYQIGYIFSYLLVFTFIISSEQTGVKQLFFKSLLAQIVILPLIVSINQQLNLISVLINPIMIVLFSYFILPLVFIGLLPFLSKTVDFYIGIFKEMITFFAGKGVLITFNTFTYLDGFCYYVFLLFICFSKNLTQLLKRTLIGFCLLMIFNLSYFVSYSGKWSFLMWVKGIQVLLLGHLINVL